MVPLPVFFQFVFEGFEIELICLIGFECFLLFTALIVFEIQFTGLLLHLLVTDGTSVGEQGKVAGEYDLIDVFFPESHLSLLAHFRAEFSGFEKDHD